MENCMGRLGSAHSNISEQRKAASPSLPSISSPIIRILFSTLLIYTFSSGLTTESTQ